jgi:hypothetical protein
MYRAPVRLGFGHYGGSQSIGFAGYALLSLTALISSEFTMANPPPADRD